MPRKAAGSLTGDPSFKKSKTVGQAIAEGVKSQLVVETPNDSTESIESTQATEDHNQQVDTRARERIKERFSETTSNTPNPTPSTTNNTSSVTSGNGLNGYLSSTSIQHGVQLPKFDVNGGYSITDSIN